MALGPGRGYPDAKIKAEAQGDPLARAATEVAGRLPGKTKGSNNGA